MEAAVKQTEAEGPFSSALMLFAGFLNSSNYTMYSGMPDDSLETRKYYNNLTRPTHTYRMNAAWHQLTTLQAKNLDPYDNQAEDLQKRIAAINPVLSVNTSNTIQMDEDECRHRTH